MAAGTAPGARLRVSGAMAMRLASFRLPAWTGSNRELVVFLKKVVMGSQGTVAQRSATAMGLLAQDHAFYARAHAGAGRAGVARATPGPCMQRGLARLQWRHNKYSETTPM